MSFTGCLKVRSCGQSLEAFHCILQRGSRDGAEQLLKNPTAVRSGGVAGVFQAQWAVCSHEPNFEGHVVTSVCLVSANHARRWSCMPKTKAASLAQLQHHSVCWQPLQHLIVLSKLCWRCFLFNPDPWYYRAKMLAWIKQAFQDPLCASLVLFLSHYRNWEFR